MCPGTAGPLIGSRSLHLGEVDPDFSREQESPGRAALGSGHSSPFEERYQVLEVRVNEV